MSFVPQIMGLFPERSSDPAELGKTFDNMRSLTCLSPVIALLCISCISPASLPAARDAGEMQSHLSCRHRVHLLHLSCISRCRERCRRDAGEMQQRCAASLCRDAAGDLSELLHLCRDRCRRDVGEMQERCRRDAREMQERCRRDAGEMQETCSCCRHRVHL
jgi:hypothetical protein